MLGECDIGLIGLGVMGDNLVLNMDEKGFRVAVFNRTATKVEAFLEGPAKGTHVVGTYNLKDFIAQLKRPRKIMLMVKAGRAIDELIDQLLPLLGEGDIIIDGGNSLFTDTERRVDALKKRGISFLGVGISGGESGARHGPSIMPGGNRDGWEPVRPIFETIAAKVDGGDPCCAWVGEGGAGHFVKMVHNGIEYGDMQLISEAYDILRNGFSLPLDQVQSIFQEWNQGPLDSYLIEITAEVLKVKESDGTPRVDKILDVAGQKGTGKWTVAQALDEGVPLTLIGEAVFARFLSSLKDEREEAESYFPKKAQFKDTLPSIESIEQALYAAKMVSYAQGFMLMRAASEKFQWKLNYGAVALMWRGGCIIRSRFLGNIKQAFDRHPDLKNLLLDPFFKEEMMRSEGGLRKSVSLGAKLAIPLPCFSSALAFLDSYRRGNLPASLLQGLRDYFGAHTYERTDRPRGEFFHTDWSADGSPEFRVC